MKTLITAPEIKRILYLSKAVPSCKVTDIAREERHLFVTNALGVSVEVYELMLAAVVDYSATLSYNNSTSYVAGNLVKYEGLVFIATSNTTGNPPTNANHWELAPKFGGENADCYNDAWCIGGLNQVIALAAFNGSLESNFVQFTNAGLSIVTSGKMEAPSTGDFKMVSEAWKRKLKTAAENFLDYVNRSTDTCLNNTLIGSDCSPCSGANMGNGFLKFRKPYRVA